MKKLMVIFMVFFAVCMTANAQTFFENFTGLTAGANLAGQSSWTKGGSGPEVTVANSTPLTYPGYNSGGGEYVVMPTGTSTSSRVYKTFTSPITSLAHSTFYYSVLLRLTGVSASSNGYFMTIGNSGTGTQYGAKLFARTSGAGFNIGVSKTSNTAAYGASVLNLNTTYLVVVRYSFNNAGFAHADSIDDEAYLWVNPALAAEPLIGAAECAVPSGTGGGDFDGFSPNPVPYDIGNFIWHNRNATNPVGAFDGVRVGYGTTGASAWANLITGFDPVVYNDPPSVNVTNAKSTMTVDGKLDEAEWATAPTMLFGPGAYRKAMAGEQTVTGGVNPKENFPVNGKLFTVPYKDTSMARVKFLRKGMNLYIGIQSDDKSICKFDWEGDGLFMTIQNAKGGARDFKLYYQNLNDTVKFEPGTQIYAQYAAVLGAGGKVNDSTNVATGYTMELAIRLDSLGYTPLSSSIPVSMVMFDPDGFTHPMNSWDTLHGAFYKTWWGSEWASSFRSLNLTPDATVYNDPPSVNVTNAKSTMTVDGKMDEAEWATAPTLLFGPGAYRKALAGEQTVTGGVNVKENFDVNGKKFTVPYKDTSMAKVKFLRKGMNLYIGIQSDDKSLCKFDWEGDGLYMQIQNAKGAAREVKLYYQNLNDTVKFEPGSQIFGQYAAVLGAGGKVNDSTNVANGYTMELALRLDSLGYTPLSSNIPVAMTIFDPDGFTHPMNSWDTLHGAYYKTWWGSEWGSSFRSLNLTPDAAVYADPDTMLAANVTGTMTVDGKLDEPEWANAPSLLFGPGAYRKAKTGDKTVTGGVNVKENFDVNGKKFTVPYKDTSMARVKFLRKGMNLYIGIQSDDKSICKFDWEGDGLYMQIQNSKGSAREIKLYYQNLNDTVKFEPGSQIYGQYAAVLGVGGKVNDSTNVANGYTMELAIRLDSLGYTATSTAVPVAMTIFDPDGFTHPMNSWDTLHGAYYKTWWGSEWGSSFRTIKLAPTTGVVEGKVDGVPTVFSLAQNYPNPFNPTTMIRFGVPEASYVTLKVYDIVGREIATLTQGNYTPGFYNVSFVAQNLASGVYFYQISSKPLSGGKQTFVNTKKLLLLK